MHKTEAGEKRKGLKRTALELEKEVKALQNIHQMRPAARTRQDEADRLKAEAETLKDKARLEDLHVWEMEKEKPTKKGAKTYTYWVASWREGTVYVMSILAAPERSMLRLPGRSPKDESRGSRVTPFRLA